MIRPLLAGEAGIRLHDQIELLRPSDTWSLRGHDLPTEERVSKQPGKPSSEGASATPRQCGTCDVCCTAMHVAELKKPAGTVCAHMKGPGCGIYERRPAACRDWYCMWVRDGKGIFTDAQRPDRLGVFFTASKQEHGKQIIYAHPVRSGAETGQASAVIEQLRRFVPVRVLPFRQARAFTPLTSDGRPMAEAFRAA